MSSAFEHAVSDKASASQAYQSFLAADKQLEALLGNLPRWLKADGGGEGLPERVGVSRPCAPCSHIATSPDLARHPARQMMRSTFLISLQHKILSIHRPFLAKPSRANSYSFSRRRVTEAARAILREAPRARGIRIWTVLYHISVASFSLTLELYEQLKQASPDNEAIRSEIHQALPTLEALKQASAIAERGLGLVLPLLADEQRMRTEGGTARKDRRKVRPPSFSLALPAAPLTVTRPPAHAEQEEHGRGTDSLHQRHDERQPFSRRGIDRLAHPSLERLAAERQRHGYLSLCELLRARNRRNVLDCGWSVALPALAGVRPLRAGPVLVLCNARRTKRLRLPTAVAVRRAVPLLAPLRP